MQRGDLATAERLLNKSIRLQDNVEARVLLKQVKREGNTEQQSTAGATGGGDYTKEQEELARNIVAKKDYYAALELNKDATDADIKKAYRKVFICVEICENELTI